MHTRLHADAHRLVSTWVPTDDVAGEHRGRFLDLLAETSEAARADNPGAHLTASAMIVNAELDQVLLCLHGRFGRWVQVGGHCEPDDRDIAGTALREATEESGIAGLRIHPHPIDLDIHPVTCRYGPSHHYDIRFAIIAPPGAVERVSAESRALGWFAPDALPQPLASATERLVAPAIAVAAALRQQ